MKDSNTPDYHVDRFVLHDGWDRKTQSNDVAVVKVKERIEYKTNEKQQFIINKVCLPVKGFELKTGTATLSGFGQTGATAGQAEYLQKLDVPIYDQNQCAINYKKYVKINEMKICAGGKGGQDSCMVCMSAPNSLISMAFVFYNYFFRIIQNSGRFWRTTRPFGLN